MILSWVVFLSWYTVRCIDAQTWSYTNPDSWHSEYPMCATELQAPISLRHASVRSGSDAFVKLTPIKGYTNNTFDIVTLVHNYSFFMDLRPLQLHFASSLTPMNEYTLRSVVLKYPCEHVLPLGAMDCSVELQYKYEPVDVEVTLSPARVIFVQQYVESNDPNIQTMPLLSALNESSRAIQSSGSLTTRVTISYSELFSEAIYDYIGSDNVPPCSQGFRYLVSATQIPASAGVLQNLRDRSQQLGASNARPLQSVGGRKVTKRNVYTSAPRAQFIELLRLPSTVSIQGPEGNQTATKENPVNFQLISAIIALACIAGSLIFFIFVGLLHSFGVIRIPLLNGHRRKSVREQWVNTVDGVNVFGVKSPIEGEEDVEGEENALESKPESDHSEMESDAPIGAVNQ